jgi:hypothetical protein
MKYSCRSAPPYVTTAGFRSRSCLPMRACAGQIFFLRLILHETKARDARTRLYRLRIIPLFPRQILHETFIARVAQRSIDPGQSSARAVCPPFFPLVPPPPPPPASLLLPPPPAFPSRCGLAFAGFAASGSRDERRKGDGPRIIRVHPFSGRVGADKKCPKRGRWRGRGLLAKAAGQLSRDRRSLACTEKGTARRLNSTDEHFVVAVVPSIKV